MSDFAVVMNVIFPRQCRSKREAGRGKVLDIYVSSLVIGSARAVDAARPRTRRYLEQKMAAAESSRTEIFGARCGTHVDAERTEVLYVLHAMAFVARLL